ncbi:MAG: radical SAM protein, partial [Planctomycetaceae bacterium]
MIRAVAPSLDAVREKVEAGVRLDAAEAEMLWDDSVSLHELGELANLVRERKNGNLAFYNINTHLNPTNVCVYRCTFCAFRADLREARGYVMSDEQILARGREAVDAGSTEMHIVGGLHHQKDYDWYLNIIRLLHDHHPSLHLKAWTPVEINWFCHLTKRSVR